MPNMSTKDVLNKQYIWMGSKPSGGTGGSCGASDGPASLWAFLGALGRRALPLEERQFGTQLQSGAYC